MAKRNEKLTKVRDYRFSVPMVGVAARKATAQVLLDTETGIFQIELPKEVVTVLKRENIVTGRELNVMLREFDRVLEKYGSIIRAEGREKVIVLNYKKNWPGRDSNGDIFTFSVGMKKELGGSFSFDQTPNLGMALDYEVLWKIGDRGIFEIIFCDDDETPAGDPAWRYAAEPKEMKVIPWCEEREAFFAAMRDGLGSMIERMNRFFSGDFISNVDRAIAHGGNGLALPSRQPALPSPDEGKE